MMTDQATNCITDEQKNLTTPTNAITTNDNNTKQDNISQHENEENVNNTGVGVVDGGGGISSDVIVKIEHSSPSPSIYNNNSENSNQTPTDFNYDLKISSPISWAFEPIKTEKSQNATTTIYAVKKTRKSSSSRSTSTISSTSVKSPIGGRINLRTKARVLQNQLTNSTSASEKKYRILFQNQRIRKESLEHSEDMIYNSEYEKPWICRNCNRNYKWKNSLKCHLKNECGQPPRFFCNKMCGYRTNVHSNLKRHLNTKCKNRDDESTQQ